MQFFLQDTGAPSHAGCAAGGGADIRRSIDLLPVIVSAARKLSARLARDRENISIDSWLTQRIL
jgi:hypothetical protein